MPPEQFKPSDDESGTPNHHVERFEGLLLAGQELRDPLHNEFKVGLDRGEIDALGSCRGMNGWSFGNPIAATGEH